MFSEEVYLHRRQKLKNQLHSGIALFLGNVETPMNYPDNTFPFRQDSSFLYFFGIDHPHLAGLIDFESGEEIIFGNEVEIEDIIWMGNLESIADKAAKAGVKKVLPYDKLHEVIAKATTAKRKVHFLPPYRHENMILLSELVNLPVNELKKNASIDLIKAVVALRSVKEPWEIEEIENCEEIAWQMHVTSMKMAKPGVYEYQIAGRIQSIALEMNGSLSFPIILSMNGQILHNHSHANKLVEGRMMVTDAGAESAMHYATDLTRTVPVGGKFSQRQKEIYEIVLNANNTATSLMKPGVFNRDVHLATAKVIASGLKEVGLMKGNIDEAVAAGAHTLFFPHGLGHMMGLDVHDMEDLGENYVGYDEEIQRSTQFGTAYLRLGRRLQPNFVLTNEPGIYFIPALIDKFRSEGKFLDFVNYDKVETYKNFGGIRIEDDILITSNGARILGKRVPVTVVEIEETMRS
jgi:Xaa-Pro aminopeptidase